MNTTVSIGIAAAAIKQAVQLCETKTAAYRTVALRDQQLVHYLMGKAQSRVSASRDTLHAAAAAAYEEVSRSNALLALPPTPRFATRWRPVSRWRPAPKRCGSSMTSSEHPRMVGAPFERHFRDVHVLMQHATKSNGIWRTAGRALLGLEPDRFWFIF